MKTAILPVLLILALAAGQAGAAVVLNLGAGNLTKNDGVTSLAVGRTYVVLADADGDGFGDLTQATNDWKADPGDVVAYRGSTNGFGGTTGSTFDAVSFDLSGALGVGDRLMLVWYDKPFNAADTGPGAGVYFGSYRTDDILNYSDIG